MKIIRVDSYDREGPGFDDRFLFFIRDEIRARKIVELINKEDHGDAYYRAVPNEYELKRFEP